MQKLETIKTIVFDITHDVFYNDTNALMYVTKDIHADSYIISIPCITFSIDIVEERGEENYRSLHIVNVFGDKDKVERLITAIKQAIEEFE